MKLSIINCLGHPRIDSTVYITKDPQPDHNPCLAQLLQVHFVSLSLNHLSIHY